MDDTKYNEIVDKDFPKTVINDQTRETTIKESARFRGGVRLSTARFPTTEEYENYRNGVLKTELP